nr:MAG TPA: hypothetical protein [Caudoviricetes sp.]
MLIILTISSMDIPLSIFYYITKVLQLQHIYGIIYVEIQILKCVTFAKF